MTLFPEKTSSRLFEKPLRPVRENGVWSWQFRAVNSSHHEHAKTHPSQKIFVSRQRQF